MPFLNDGFSTLITSNLGDQSVTFREKEVTPIGYEVGSIDTVTMRNQKMRTKHNKHLLGTDDMTLIVNYNPAQEAFILNNFMGIITTWKITFPDATVQNFVGWLDSFKKQALKEGEFPLAEVKIVPSNANADGTELVPGPGPAGVWTPAGGVGGIGIGSP